MSIFKPRREVRECNMCGNTFKVRPSVEQEYCSIDCHEKDRGWP